MGMTDNEILMNKAKFESMGLLWNYLNYNT
jgi:hypothetical protein